jgi:hypothetical protein
MHSLNYGKSCQKSGLHICVIFKITVKINNHPLGENSPNLVTLAGPMLKLFRAVLAKKLAKSNVMIIYNIAST